MKNFHAKAMDGTTVIGIRRGDRVAMGSDGQVTLHPNIIVKHNAKKVRKLTEHKVLVGFAGAVADAFSLLEQLEGFLSTYQGNLQKSAIELAKKWRTDKLLRHLDAMLAVANSELSLMISGSGEVIEPSDGILAIGSGAMYARAAAQALLTHTQLLPVEIVKESLLIASSICIYTNNNIAIEEL